MPSLQSVTTRPARDTLPISLADITAEDVEIFSATCTQCCPFLSTKMPITILKESEVDRASIAGVNIEHGKLQDLADPIANLLTMSLKLLQHQRSSARAMELAMLSLEYSDKRTQVVIPKA